MRRHIAFFNIPMKGHVYPTLPIVVELVRRGHRVSYATTAERASIVGATGATVVPYTSTRPSDSAGDVDLPGRLTFISEIMLTFMTEAEATLPQLEPWCSADPPDLIVHDRLAFAGRLLAAKLDLPAVQLWPMLISGEHWSIARELGIFDPSQPSYVEFLARREALVSGLGLTLSLDDFLHPGDCRHLGFYPRAFQYAGDLFDDRYSFVGPCLGPRPFHPAWRPAGDGRPVVLISLGTIYNNRPDFYLMCAEAFGGSSWRVVLPVGERIDLADLGAVPDNVEVLRSVNPLDVLAHATAFVSPAGMGGLMEALSRGVGVVTMPVTPEQEVNAARAIQLGLGVRLDPDGLTAIELRDAVDRVAKDNDIARSADSVRRDILTAGGAVRAADVIEAAVR